MSRENVVHPSHYQMEDIHETMDVINYALTDEEFAGFLKGNVLKYILRAPYKNNSEEDWSKAAYYMQEYQDYFGEDTFDDDEEDEEEGDEEFCNNLKDCCCNGCDCEDDEDDEELRKLDRKLLEELLAYKHSLSEKRPKRN